MIKIYASAWSKGRLLAGVGHVDAISRRTESGHKARVIVNTYTCKEHVLKP